MKHVWSTLIGIAILLAGCASFSASAKVTAPELPDRGPAPEITNRVWVNSDEPLRLENLRGKVVIIDMWTYNWINCRNVIPSLRGWYEKYSPDLMVIGIHYPEYEEEKSLVNLKKAVAELEIPYPVAQDNGGKTWRMYQSRYWPTLYLIDKQGNLRYTHIGEGNYAEIEAAIEVLLAEPVE